MSLGDTAHRIPVCRGTSVIALVTDTTNPAGANNTANGGATECFSFGCQVADIQATAKYISRSSDGKDTDRMTLLPK
jgi:hypothetical protein